MAKCKGCGHAGGETDRFCTECGRRLTWHYELGWRKPWNDGLGWIRRHWWAVVQFGWLAALFWFCGWLWVGGYSANASWFDQGLPAAVLAALAMFGGRGVRMVGRWARSASGREWLLGQVSWLTFGAGFCLSIWLLPDAEGATQVLGRITAAAALGGVSVALWHIGKWAWRKHREDTAAGR